MPDVAPDSEESTSKFHAELRERFEHMLLRHVSHDEMGGQPEHGSHERLSENKMQQVDLRPTAVRNWANGVLQGKDPFPIKRDGPGIPYFWPEH